MKKKQAKLNPEVAALLAKIHAYYVDYYTNVCPQSCIKTAADYRTMDAFSFYKDKSIEHQIDGLKMEVEDREKWQAERLAGAAN